jgi:hypothetical protein
VDGRRLRLDDERGLRQHGESTTPALFAVLVAAIGLETRLKEKT